MPISFKKILKKSKVHPLRSIQKRIKEYLKRRPHRSFHRTRRRDYARTMKMPGYVAFTKSVTKIIWKNKKIFLRFALVYIILSALMVGLSSQETYSTLQTTIKSTGGDIVKGSFGGLAQAGLLFISSMSGGLSSELTGSQQIFAVIIFLMAWLTCVWLLRNIMANRKVKLRDGIYNAGSPIISTFLVALLLLVQLLPLAIAIVGYGAAATTGLLDNGVEAMLFWAAAGLMAVLSIYLMTSSVFALIIITLPGMYPMAAIKAAGDLVIGRRVRIIARFLWMLLCVLFGWALIMIPMILFDSWIKEVWSSIKWLPIVPISILVMTSVTVIWVSTYIYLLYRKVVDDGAEPA